MNISGSIFSKGALIGIAIVGCNAEGAAHSDDASKSAPARANSQIAGSAGNSLLAPGAPLDLEMTTQTPKSISLHWKAPENGSFPVTTYRVYRNGSLYATVHRTEYTDAHAVNATVPSFIAPATIYAYSVSAVDTQGKEGAAALPKVYFYRNGVARQSEHDYSYGNMFENWRDSSGNPPGGTHDVKLTFGGGFQPYADEPLSPGYDLEIGSFKFFTIDIKVTDASLNSHFFLIHISRLPPGDVYPWMQASLTSYCKPIANQWVTCKIPLSAVSMGMTKFTGAIVGKKLTVTSVQDGVGVDAGGFISGPGVPTGTYIVNHDQSASIGTYTVGGPGITASTNVSSTTMTEQRTSLYKFNLHEDGGGSPTTIYVNNFGWTSD